MYDDDEIRDAHPFSCAVWTSNDPCDCGSFQTGVERLVNCFESYAPSDAPAGGAA